MKGPEATTHIIYIGLGSNLGDRAANLRRAVALLGERVGEVMALSSFYESEAQGFQSDYRFLNAACAVRTHHSAEALLHITEEIEREMGRTEKTRACQYADRLIDIDLLTSPAEEGDLSIHTAYLDLPHPRLAERDFVLRPLSEIAPDLIVPSRDGKRRLYVDEALAELQGPHIAELTDLPPAGQDDLLRRINALLPQLSASAKPLTEDQLRELMENPYTHLYCAYDDEGTLCGMVTLCLCASPTGVKCWAEDVVVDAAYRGKGYGRALMERIKIYARHLGAKSLNFTSQPGRVAANALYQSIGYELRTTNVYRFSL